MHTYAYDVYSLFSYTSHDNLLDLEKLKDVMRRGKSPTCTPSDQRAGISLPTRLRVLCACALPMGRMG